MWSCREMLLIHDISYHVDTMLSCGMKSYNMGQNVFMWKHLLSYRMKCYLFIAYVIFWTHCHQVRQPFLFGWNVFKFYHNTQYNHVRSNVMMWGEMLECGMKCKHVGWNGIIWIKYYLMEWNVIIWNKMLSFGQNVIL